jgi:heme A synthase
MSRDTIQLIATYAIAALILLGGFLIIRDPAQTDAQKTQAWLLVGLVAGYIFRDAGGASATRSAVQIAAAQPTTTVSGNPPTTTIAPPPPVAQP